jgi:hypothetical protein
MEIWLKDVPEWAIIFCRLELIRNLILQFIVVVQTGIGAEGRIKSFSIMRSISYFLPLPLAILFFSLGFPPYTMYILWILSWGVGGIFIVLYYANKNYGLSIKEYIANVVLPSGYLFVITFVLGYLPLLFMERSFLRLILVGTITSTAFLASLWFISLNTIEKELIISMVKKISGRYFKKVKLSQVKQ